MMTNSRTMLAMWVAALGVGCVEDYPLVNEILSFEVVFAESADTQPTGSEDARMPYVAGAACLSDTSCPEGQVCVDGEEGKICAVRYLFDVVAYGRDGKPFPYRGPLSVR
ncbi:MAG: hypothetical protein QF464_23105, partial [Myxococcota bacterium]|nr:hypothetical protein [Myxococcota bacterium]